MFFSIRTISLFLPAVKQIMVKVKKSQIPNSGKGLFADRDYKKGDIIVEYEGEKVSWKECQERNQNQKGHGGYYLYINKNNCVDAQYTLWAKGRYANDASGFIRVAGLRNNARYEIIKGKPFIVATRKINAGDEIFVSYGRAYWAVMKSAFEKG